MQASDVPGYTGDGTGGPETKSDSDESDAQLATCAGQPDPGRYWLGEYSSDEFSSADLQIDSDVTSYSSTAAIAIDRALIANPARLATCFKQEFASAGSGLPAGSTVESVNISPPASGLPTNVLGNVAIELTTTSGGQKVPVYLDEVLIVGVHVDESLSFTSQAPIPTAIMNSLTTTIANRIAAV